MRMACCSLFLKREKPENMLFIITLNLKKDFLVDKRQKVLYTRKFLLSQWLCVV